MAKNGKASGRTNGHAKKKSSALPQRVAEIERCVRHTNEFGGVLRLIWRPGAPGGELGRERNDSHVGQLVDVAWFVQNRYLPHLDLLRVMIYCIVHDKPETYAGDTPAFADKFGKYDSSRTTHANKEERERWATARLKDEWGGLFPALPFWLEQYQKQADEESQFVYALDKFLSDLNIYGDNGRTNHELGITFDKAVEYKRKRIAAHPFILELYDEYVEATAVQQDLFFQGEV